MNIDEIRQKLKQHTVVVRESDIEEAFEIHCLVLTGAVMEIIKEQTQSRLVLIEPAEDSRGLVATFTTEGVRT